MSTDATTPVPDAFPGPLLRKRKQREEADMDITPMIDITFLLLIFFLVCSTPDQKSSIELPSARHGKGVGEREAVIITLSDEGADLAPVYLADGKIESARLPDDSQQQRGLIEEALKKARQQEGKESVIIKADRNVASREVARIIKAVSAVEGTKIHLAVLESD